MNALELKYGCNPNQKPSRVFMRDGSDLPFAVLNGKPGYINLLDAQAAGTLAHGEITLVVSSNEGAYALTRAANAGIRAQTISPKQCGGQAAFEAALSALLAECEIDLIVLAGFLTILSADFTARWPSRILNVHPSLIPAFCGKGMYGLKVHEAALRTGVKVTGATGLTCRSLSSTASPATSTCSTRSTPGSSSRSSRPPPVCPPLPASSTCPPPVRPSACR